MLEIVANVAAVLTGAAATIAYCQYRYQRRLRRTRLEEHLKAALATGNGLRSVRHLTAALI